MKGVRGMKKSNFVVGVLYVVAGLAFLLAALLLESKLEGILWGLAGAGIASGLGMLCKYFYWSSPKNSARYAQRLENEEIEQHDELKEKLRDKAGRRAYVAGIIVLSVSMLVLSVLGALEIMPNAKTLVLYLGGYLVFQVAAGIVIFNHMLKQY